MPEGKVTDFHGEAVLCSLVEWPSKERDASMTALMADATGINISR